MLVKNWKANTKKSETGSQKDTQDKKIQDFLCENQKTTGTPRKTKSSKNNYT